MNRKNQSRCDLNRDLVMKMAADGSYLVDIGKAVGTSAERVRDFLLKNGVSDFSEKVLSRCEENRDLVLKMEKDGAYLNHIAKAVGTTGFRVKEFLRRNGVTREFSKAMPGEKNPRWIGGRLRTKDGYIYVYSPNHPDRNYLGYVREHRLVMENVLGRRLSRSEVVHHKNKIRDDNRPENLEIYESNKKHLAEELLGKRPKWTKDGLQRMKEGVARSANLRRKRNRPWLRPDDVKLR